MTLKQGRSRAGGVHEDRSVGSKETEMRQQNSVTDAQEYAESIINTVREPLIVLDQDLRVVAVSRSFYDFFKVNPDETVGHLIYDLGDKQWDIPKLRELLGHRARKHGEDIRRFFPRRYALFPGNRRDGARLAALQKTG